jgi:flavin reductase (DIM6/NTAB) family NADH-FMN oxidoreductase RutF
MAGGGVPEVAADRFRAVMRRFPTGVTIVTTILDGRPKGFTATAVASLSLTPPLVLVCVNRLARSHPIVSQAGRFCVNLLRLDQEDLARAFAARSDADPFAWVHSHADLTGSPVLDGTLAHLDCELAEEYSAGTHTIFIGRVVSCGASDGAPLGYFNGGYRDFGMHVP